MQLPDESLEYRYAGCLAPPPEAWTPLAEMQALHLLSPNRVRGLMPLMMQVRSQVAAERELRDPPPELRPLEPGFIDLPQRTLDGHRRKGDSSDLGRVLSRAARLREQADRVVVVAAGGLHLSAKLFFDALLNRHHNERPHRARLGVPRVYFAGDGFDSDSLAELFDLLDTGCLDPEVQAERWALVALSRDGGPLESAAAYRLVHKELAKFYGANSDRAKKLCVPVTSPTSSLRDLAKGQGIDEGDILPYPDHVGSRFAAFTAAGLLPAAVMGLDVRALLLGAAAMTRRFLEEPFDRNPVLQHAAVNYLMTEELGKRTRVLVVGSPKLEAFGRWYEAVVGESLGKQSRGPTPLATVAGRDYHARGQQLQEGHRSAAVTHLTVAATAAPPLGLAMADRNEDDLNQFNRRTLPEIQRAARAGVDRALADVARPTAEITMPALNEHSLGQLMQMVMLATVIEGRLMGINPYGQPGVDAAQRHARAALKAVCPG